MVFIGSGLIKVNLSMKTVLKKILACLVLYGIVGWTLLPLILSFCMSDFSFLDAVVLVHVFYVSAFAVVGMLGWAVCTLFPYK